MMDNSLGSLDMELYLVTSCHILIKQSLQYQMEIIGPMTLFTYQVGI